jgi:hypothetical protein
VDYSVFVVVVAIVVFGILYRARAKANATTAAAAAETAELAYQHQCDEINEWIRDHRDRGVPPAARSPLASIVTSARCACYPA